MVYKDYKVASIRHLETCQYMCQNLKQVQNPKEKKHILANIYYLSGYVIECIINYAIYDYLGYPMERNVKRLDDTTRQISFGGSKFKYQIRSHNFRTNCEILLKLPDISQVPFIDSSNIPPKYQNVKILYKKWSPNARYEDYQFTEQKVRQFVDLCKEIHFKILRYITKG